MSQTEQPTEARTYRVYFNYTTRSGAADRRRAAGVAHVRADSAEAAAAEITARGRLVAEVREA